jgi:tRNA A37 N6-isopentenylltransferase MiaA
MFDAGLAEEVRRILALGYPATQQYAKRQLTWFRREAGLVWLRGFGDAAEIRDEAVRKVREFLGPSSP